MTTHVVEDIDVKCLSHVIAREIFDRAEHDEPVAASPATADPERTSTFARAGPV